MASAVEYVVKGVDVDVYRVLPSNEDDIYSLRDLLHQNVDQGVSVPSYFPCETALSDGTNSQKLRFSDTDAHANIRSNLSPEIMCFTQEPIPKVLSGHTLAQYGPYSAFRPREVMQNGYTRYSLGASILILFNSGQLLGWQSINQGLVFTLRKQVSRKESWVRYLHSTHILTFAKLQDSVIASLRRPSPAFGSAPFIQPDINRYAEISRFDPQTRVVTFSDGSFIGNADAVVFVTTCDFNFPFLPGLKSVHKRISMLYQKVFRFDGPTLAFIGDGWLRNSHLCMVKQLRPLASWPAVPSHHVVDKWSSGR